MNHTKAAALIFQNIARILKTFVSLKVSVHFIPNLYWINLSHTNNLLQLFFFSKQVVNINVETSFGVIAPDQLNVSCWPQIASFLRIYCPIRGKPKALPSTGGNNYFGKGTSLHSGCFRQMELFFGYLIEYGSVQAQESDVHWFVVLSDRAHVEHLAWRFQIGVVTPNDLSNTREVRVWQVVEV